MHMLPGALVEKSASTKDELVISSTDIDLAGRSAALIHQRHDLFFMLFSRPFMAFLRLSPLFAPIFKAFPWMFIDFC